MANFRKLFGTFFKINFFRPDPGVGWTPSASPTIGYEGRKLAGALGNYVALSGVRLASPGKMTHIQAFIPSGAALAAGIAVAPVVRTGGIVLTSAKQTLTTSIVNPDVGRTIKFVNNQAGIGDGTFALATGVYVSVFGTNTLNEAIAESVALNGTSAVYTIQAFRTVTSIVVPPLVTAGDTLTVTGGPSLGFERPIEASGDILAWGQKPTGSPWSQIATPATYLVGFAYGAMGGTGTILGTQDAGSLSTTTIKTLTASIVGTFPSAPFLLEILEADGTLELVTVSSVATSGGYTIFTIFRGLHGQTARLRSHNAGVTLNYRAPFTINPASISANDKYGAIYASRTVA